MKNLFRLILLSIAWSVTAFAQQTFDARQYAMTAPIRQSAAFSGTCTDGELFEHTTESNKLYICFLNAWIAIGGGGSGTPGGSDTQIQINDSGSFGASANLTFSANQLRVGPTGTMFVGPALASFAPIVQTLACRCSDREAISPDPRGWRNRSHLFRC